MKKLLLLICCCCMLVVAHSQAPADVSVQDSTLQQGNFQAKGVRSKGAQTKPKHDGSNAVTAEDYRRDGLFKAIFHAGLNGAQVDGDDQIGYYKFGLDAGVGVMVRFHKYLSVSMMFDYSMKGAVQSLSPTRNALNYYKVQWDYAEIPLLLNIHDKNIIMFSIGPQVGIMVRYKELDSNGDNVTSAVINNTFPLYGAPHRIDLEGVAALHFLIKKQFGIGLKFSYSLIKLRGSFPHNKFNGEYNNVLTLDFMYILNTVKKK